MLIFDIETTPNPAMTGFLPEIKPPGNMTKPETIARWHEENEPAARQEQYNRMALDMCLARIRAIGYQSVELPEMTTIAVIHDEKEERVALQNFWRAHFEHRGRVVGYNILNFDLPVLLWRSMMLEVRPILKIGGRYDNDIIDLYDLLVLRNNRLGSMAGLGLKRVCQMLNIPNPLPDIDGSMVIAMTDGEVSLYLRNDLFLTRQLFERMAGGYHSFLPAEEIPF